MAVRVRHPHAPGRFSTWEEWRLAVRRPKSSARPFPCPLCWGQGRIWEPGPLGLMPVICAECRNTR